MLACVVLHVVFGVCASVPNSGRFSLRMGLLPTRSILPVAGGSTGVPVRPYTLTNNIPWTTNRAVLPKQLRVLILGNSLFGDNDLAGVINKVATGGKFPIEATARTADGYVLENHYNNIQSRLAISYTVRDPLNLTNRHPWDAVILQEHSLMPVLNWVTSLNSMRKLDLAVRDARSQTMLFMTWARPHGIFGHREFLTRTDQAYQLFRQQLNAPVAWGGWAVELAESRRPRLKLRQRNNINPTAHGTYLTACVLYAYLTWQSPVGLNNGGLFAVHPDEMRFLQGIAWEIFQWRKTGLPF